MVRKPVARKTVRKPRRARASASAVRKPARKVARRPAVKKSVARRSPAKKAAKGGPVRGTPSPVRTRMTPELQAHVKRLYETTDQPVCQIALDVGINESVIRRMGPREGWVRFVAPPRDLPPLATLLAEVEALEASLSLPPPSRASSARDGGGEGGSGARERDGVGWGESSVSFDACLEGPMLLPPTPNPSPPFEERTGGGEQDDPIARFIRIVTAHIDEFEAVRRDGKLLPKHHLQTARALSILTEAFNRLQRLRASLNGPSHDDYSDMPADLDAFRDDLARRIDAFIESRADAGDAQDLAAAPSGGA
ncbi:MAG TPA: hypothetical protein VNR39_13445 [Pseudolabrys sp.]|nr:hypothetical protein [Pseudolabrys sp.]